MTGQNKACQSRNSYTSQVSKILFRDISVNDCMIVIYCEPSDHNILPKINLFKCGRFGRSITVVFWLWQRKLAGVSN